MLSSSNGFTLVEVIVVVSILGIITLFSIPLVRNITTKNEMSEYQNYYDAVESAAKLYVDSYEEDLFGHETDYCAIIRYNDLVEKNLIKDISISGVSCNSDNTFIEVQKSNRKYTYDTYLGCGKETGGTVSKVSVILPKKDTPHTPKASCHE